MAPWSAPPAVPLAAEKRDSEEASDHALGRSRGGFTTKIHVLCDGRGLPLHFELSAGQDHESQSLVGLLSGADEFVKDFEDQPVAWPVALAGDKGYRAMWIDECLIDLGIQPVIPSQDHEDRDARSVQFDKSRYRRRCVVEQLIGWLKENRRIFSRFEKTARNFAGMIKVAFIHRYLRLACPATLSVSAHNRPARSAKTGHFEETVVRPTTLLADVPQKEIASVESAQDGRYSGDIIATSARPFVP